MRTILLAAAISALSAATAMAAPWTASPSQPASKTSLVGDQVIWNCTTSGCVSTTDTSDASGTSECAALARQVGPLTAFSAKEPFDAAHMTRCNQSAPKPKA